MYLFLNYLGDPCDPGMYLEMKSQECKDCQPGTYSQSATTEIDHWENMPPDFHFYSVGNEDNDCKTYRIPNFNISVYYFVKEHMINNQ